MMLWQVFADEWVMNLWKRLFGESDDEIAPLSDREYEQLFLQLLQGVSANWDGERLGQVVKGDDGRMVVWLRGYGDRLLRETANPDFFSAVSISIIEFTILQKFWKCFNKNV